MSERPVRHVYINDDTHVKYGATNEKQGYCLTCEQFSPCSHNALIDQYEAWEKENPVSVEEIRGVLGQWFLEIGSPFDSESLQDLEKSLHSLINRKLKGQDNEDFNE